MTDFMIKEHFFCLRAGNDQHFLQAKSQITDFTNLKQL